MSYVGGWHYCFNQEKATEKALDSFKLHNPDSPYFLASDGGNDFSFLKNKYDNIFYKYYEKNLGYGKSKAWENIETTNERIEEEVKVIKEWLNRVYESMVTMKTDYVIKMEDDVLIRGKIKIPYGGNFGMCGLKTGNIYPKTILEKFKEITGKTLTPFWGAGGGVIYNANIFLSNFDNFKYFVENYYPVIKKIKKDVFACDSFIMMLYSSVGAEYKFNPDLIETNYYNWEKSHHPIVHNFKKYYTKPKESYIIKS